MLCVQDLRGGQERDLVAVFHGHERSFECDDGLAGAYIALQQAAHRARLAHVADDLAQNALLRGRRLEGQHLFQRFPHVFAGHKGRAFALAHPPPLQLQAEFQVPQLLKDEPAVRRGIGVLQVGKGRVRGREE